MPARASTAGAPTSRTCPSTPRRSTSTAIPAATITCTSRSTTHRPTCRPTWPACACARSPASPARCSACRANASRSRPAGARAVRFRPARPARRVHRSGRGRPEVPGQPHRLPGHRPVPRPPAGAREAARAGPRQVLPQLVGLHRHRQRACGGALETTSVDLSATYLEWASRNLALNGFTGADHRLMQFDALDFLQRDRGHYGLIFVDPPTFSNSKRADDFDVQRDHVKLLEACNQRLTRDGVVAALERFAADWIAALGSASIEELDAAVRQLRPPRRHPWLLAAAPAPRS
ncbi:Ribosomal RNA large subunit methyltransferase K/L [Lysinibacillus sphaericus]